MRAVDIIQKKRDGGMLTAGEIEFFISRYNSGEIPDYQAAAWLMAVYFRGMGAAETAALTKAIVDSGQTLDFEYTGRVVVDKHSTGGVGDKTTLVLLPLVAAAGVTVAKLSGRGLGHTGGTVDKLSCIPGFRTDLDRDSFMAQVAETGLAVIGQSPQMTPADGKLYALRDVTGTVDSIPLIASSVMSKKIAAGANGIVLDVKAGSGAFMRTADEAMELARAMVAIGKNLNRRTVAMVTAMEQPLGRAVGNHLEVIEAIETLSGNGPADLTELCLRLGAEMLVLSGLAGEPAAAYDRLHGLLREQAGLSMLKRWITAQGGDTSVVEEPLMFGSPRCRGEIRAARDGYVVRLEARAVGEAAMILGAGREKKGDEIDLLAGILLHRKTGDFIRQGDLLAEMFTRTEEKLDQARPRLEGAFATGAAAPDRVPLVLGRVE